LEALKMGEEVLLCQTHIDYQMSTTSLDFPVPAFTIFGTLKTGQAVQVLVNNFMPYFYVQPVNGKSYSEEDLEHAIHRLGLKGMLLNVEAVLRQSILGYSESRSMFYKLTFNTPHVFTQAKMALESGLSIRTENVRFKVYESNFPFVLRFMVDLGIVGMNYIRIKKYDTVSKLPLVISTLCEMIESMSLEGEHVKLPPFKILSIDIECVGKGNSFPTAKTDPVIQIGNTVTIFNGDGSMKQDIFCLHETAGIPGSSVHWYATEKELLESWRRYFMEEDPDIIIGYNIKGFDIPYLLERGEILSIENFSVLGRTSKKVKARDTTMSSNVFGSISATEVDIEGRLIFDLMHVIRRDFKLRSYSLNSVSTHFLNEQKEDVPHSSIGELQARDKDSRRRIASYCLRDTVLPLRLFSHLSVLVNYTELARVTGVPIDYFSTRGIAIKVLTLIYRAAVKEDYVIPALDVIDTDQTYEGGFVIDPKRGFYKQPIAVMDFSSLYPSIMISKNLCYTTLLTRKQYEAMGGTATPTEDHFCSEQRKKGLLPRVLLDLLTSRKKTRAELAVTSDEAIRACLQGRQLAIKLCANSLYGFTGAPTGKLPCYEISRSVTAFGREMIAFTKKLVEENFCRAKGYSHDSVVIYGDTDSIMVDFKEDDLHKVFGMGKEISEFVTQRFIKPVSLEFEKVYFPYLLINKKRYAGLTYSNPDAPSRIDTKGIETIRRDNCELVKDVVERVLEKILFDKDVEGAKEYVRETVRDLYLGKVDLSKLIISKSLTKSGEKYGSKQAHVELAEKLRKRDESTAPVLGDRVAYVIVSKGKKVPAYEKSEDPVYALENNLPIDTEYYIEQQLSKPVHRIFEPIMDNVYELFRGDHTKVVVPSTPFVGPMNAFIERAVLCVGCRAAGKIICDHCARDFPVHLQRLKSEVEEKKVLLNQCWVECQRCQGSISNEVLCVNRDCPIFYMRTKVRKELGPLSEKLDQLYNHEW
jgi:DNA polymerase delta subunit 1